MDIQNRYADIYANIYTTEFRAIIYKRIMHAQTIHIGVCNIYIYINICLQAKQQHLQISIISIK